MNDQASQNPSPSPVLAGSGSARWKVGLLVVGAVTVVGVGLLGPRSSPPAETTASAANAPATLSDVSASQVGSAVTVQGASTGRDGVLVVTLAVGSTVLAAAEAVPVDGRFAVTLRPRVPPGGLIASWSVATTGDLGRTGGLATSGGPPTSASAGGSIVLEATTAFRRSVDPATGLTRLAGSRP